MTDLNAIKAPEGIEVGVTMYLKGIITDGANQEPADIVLTMSGFSFISKKFVEELSVEWVVDRYKLKDIGHSWRMMTREEIDDYKKAEHNQNDGIETTQTLFREALDDVGQEEALDDVRLTTI